MPPLLGVVVNLDKSKKEDGMNPIRTTSRFPKQSWFVRVIQVFCLILISGLISTPVWSCDGIDYKNTLQILYDTLVVGYNMGFTGDYNKYMPMVENLSKKSLALPPSCQSLLEQWSKNFSNRYNPGSTNCFGSVCCDGSGCVGN
jgi:hypothetical protein